MAFAAINTIGQHRPPPAVQPQEAPAIDHALIDHAFAGDLNLKKRVFDAIRKTARIHVIQWSTNSEVLQESRPSMGHFSRISRATQLRSRHDYRTSSPPHSHSHNLLRRSRSRRSERSLRMGIRPKEVPLRPQVRSP